MEQNWVCKVHGELTPDKYWIATFNATNKKGVFQRKYHRCKLCIYELRLKKLYKCKVHGDLTPEDVYSDGKCKECTKKRTGDYKKNNRALINERIAKDKITNPEKWEKIQKKQYQDKKAKYGKLLSLKKICDLRGITLEDYHRMIEEQDNKCILCHLEETRIDGRTKMKQRLVLDHCHKTNKFRGLICHACNLAIHKLENTYSLAYRWARYIKQGGFNDL